MYINLKQLVSFLKISVMKLPPFLLVASLSVIGLSACGGGSSGNVDEKAIITPDNAISIVEVVASVAMGFDEFVGFIDLTESNVLSDVSNPDALAIVTKVGLSRLGGDAVSYILIEKETFPCAVSGLVTVWGNIADPNTLTAGDVINIDSDMCDDGIGEIVDGLLAMTIVSIEGDIDTLEFLLDVGMIFTNVTVTESGETTTLNGDIRVTLDMLTAAMAEIIVSGDSLTSSGMGKTQSISNFSYTHTEDSSEFPVVWTYNGKGTVGDSSEFAGTVSYETPVKFEGSGENYPHTGELLVTGANNATLRFIAIDDINIQIDADYDGDEIVDKTWDMTWVDLEE